MCSYYKYIHNIKLSWLLIKAWRLFRPLSNGQRGEVYEVSGDRVAVILDIDEKNANEGEEDKLQEPSKPPIYWIDGNFFLLNKSLLFNSFLWVENIIQFNVDEVAVLICLNVYYCCVFYIYLI